MRSTTRFAATASLALAVLGMPGVALAAGPDAPAARGAAADARPAAASSAAAEAAVTAGRAVPTAVPSAAPTTAALPFVGPRAQDVVAAAPRATARPAQARAATPAVRPAKAVARPATPVAPGKAAARATKPAAAEAARTTAAKPAADPRGNNGTFKVDGPVLDTSHGNEPHVSCAFRLNLFGYDAGQLARIAFTAVAPTPGATTRIDGLPLVSTSTAKGGQYDGSYPAAGTLSAADLGLDPAVAHHVKVRVESVNADGSEVPGGAKTKVFWLEPCAAVQPAVVEAVTSAPVTTTPVAAPRSVRPVTEPIASAPIAEQQQGSAVLGSTVSARAAAPVTVLAIPELLVPQGSAQPSQLPFTGSPQVLLLLMLGIATLAGGTAVLVAVRRAA